MVCLLKEIFLFRFFAGLCCGVSHLSIVFLPVIWKMSYIWWVAEYWVVLVLLLQNIALGLTQTSKLSFIICNLLLLTTAVLTVLSVRTENVSRGFIYGSIIALLGVADIQRKFHLSDITLGDFTDSSSFLVMGVLQSLVIESHPKYSPAFHHQERIFLWHNNNSSHFPFLPSLTNPAVLLDNEVWSNLLFLGVIASSAQLSIVEHCCKTAGKRYRHPLSLSESSSQSGWSMTIFPWHEEVTLLW